MREFNCDARVVFVCTQEPLARDLIKWGVPFLTLGLSRGVNVLCRPRAFARLVNEAGIDGALLDSGGYLAAALRVGGYKGKIVAVEHGSIIRDEESWVVNRAFRRLLRMSGTWAIDEEVAVSDYALNRLLAHSHAAKVSRIYNGVDFNEFSRGDQGMPTHTRHEGDRIVLGHASRLINEKGAQDLIIALSDLRRSFDCVLTIAGDGPIRKELEALTVRLGIQGSVEFRGWVDKMPEFWQGCDIAVIPSVCEESFGMVAIEAMACGKPVVASDSGALPEIVLHGRTGIIYPKGNVAALGDSVRAYVSDRDRRLADGGEGRARCEAMFDIRRCATAYCELFK